MCSAEDHGLHNSYHRDQNKYESCRFAGVTKGLSLCIGHFPRRSWHVGYLSCLERQSPRLRLFRIPSKDRLFCPLFLSPSLPTNQLKFVLCLNAMITRIVILDTYGTDILVQCTFAFRH